MRHRVNWTPLARRDLIEIYAFIGADNIVAADRILDRLQLSAARLADHPKLGKHRPDIAPGLRILVEYPYLLIYRIVSDPPKRSSDVIEIVRVIDGRRDLKVFF